MSKIGGRHVSKLAFEESAEIAADMGVDPSIVLLAAVRAFAAVDSDKIVTMVEDTIALTDHATELRQAPGKRWLAVVKTLLDQHDPNAPCDRFVEGKPSGLCETDGHYRCDECRERASCPECNKRPSKCTCLRPTPGDIRAMKAYSRGELTIDDCARMGGMSREDMLFLMDAQGIGRPVEALASEDVGEMTRVLEEARRSGNMTAPSIRSSVVHSQRMSGIDARKMPWLERGWRP